MSDKPLIAMTGATGFVGREIVKQARAAGYPVRAIVREPKAAARWAEETGAELFHGNVIYGPSLDGAFDGVKCVIHLVGIIHAWKENTFVRAHVEATRNVIDTAKKAGTKRYLHMSALGTRPNARSRYHQTKWAAEELVRKGGLVAHYTFSSFVVGASNQFAHAAARAIAPLTMLNAKRGTTAANGKSLSVRYLSLDGRDEVIEPQIVAEVQPPGGRKCNEVHP